MPIHRFHSPNKNDAGRWLSLYEELFSGTTVVGRLGEFVRSPDSIARPWFALWLARMEHYDKTSEENVGIGNKSGPERLMSSEDLYALQAAIFLVAIAMFPEAKAKGDLVDKTSGPFFGWLGATPITSAFLEDFGAVGDGPSNAEDYGHAIAVLYQYIVPSHVRHVLGEYYTPSWLVDFVLEEVGLAKVSEPFRLVDPTCGCGSFIARAIRLLQDSPDVLRDSRFIGYDINPIATTLTGLSILAWENELGLRIDHTLATGDFIRNSDAPRVRPDSVHASQVDFIRDSHVDAEGEEENETATGNGYVTLSDPQQRDLERDATACAQQQSIVDRPIEADFIVGNPPWMTWDALSGDYRDTLASEWRETPLAVHKGWRAKVSAGKTEIATLVVYNSVNRLSKEGTVLGYVLPLSVFQSRHASRGFREFQTLSGKRYELTYLSDFSRVKLFPDASNRPCVASFTVAEGVIGKTEAIEWTQTNGFLEGNPKHLCRMDDNDVGSPLVLVGGEEKDRLKLVGKSHYRARGGVNTGGANSIMWLNVLEEDRAADTVLVENICTTRRSKAKHEKGWVERDAVRPLLVGTGIKRWSLSTVRFLMFPYLPESPKEAMAEREIASRFPLAHAYLLRFREELASRKEYHRWGCRGPFYELYRIGPYTFSRFRVFWQHTGFSGKLKACASNSEYDSLFPIPDQKVILIGCDSEEESHFVTGLLNSSITAWILTRYLGTDASPHIMDYIPIPKFDPENQLHSRVSELSRDAHQALAKGAEQRVERIEEEINVLAEEVFGG